MFRNYHADISDLEWLGSHYQKREGSLWSQMTLWGRQGPSICQPTTHEVLTQQTLTLGRKKNRVMLKKIKVNMSTMQYGVVG